LVKALLASDGVLRTEAVGPHLERCFVLIERTGAKTLEPFIRLELANLARLRGEETVRARELRAAHRLFLEIGAPIRAAEVAKELET
jgi:hypothetical protein